MDGPLAKAEFLRSAGKLDEALDVLREESREIKRVEGEPSPRLFPVNDLAAEILIDKGSLEPAAALLEKTIAARRKLLDAGRTEQAAPLGNEFLSRARLETAARRLPAAAAAAGEALRMFDAGKEPSETGIARAREALLAAIRAIDTLLGPTAEVTRASRDGAASAFVSLGMLAEAVDQKQRILEGLLAGDDEAAAAIRGAGEHLARLMMIAGRADEAIPIVDRAAKKVPLESKSEVMALRRVVGALQVAADQNARASETFAAVLENASTGPKPPAVIAAGDRLAALLVDVRRGRVDTLPEWFKVTADSLARPLPADIPLALPGLIVAAEVQQNLGNAPAAAALMTQGLALAGSTTPVDAGRLADVAGRAAATQIAAGQVAVARKTIDRVLPESRKSLGKGDPRVAFLAIMLADALDREGETAKAIELAGVSLDRGLPRPDTAWEELVTGIYDRLAAAAAGRTGSDLRERYVAARASQFGANHPHVGAACRMFGTARLTAGDWPAAAAWCGRAAEIERAGKGEDQPGYAASLTLQAHALRASGEAEKAVDTATRALTTWERVASPDHPGTLAAAEVLAAAKLQAGVTDGVVELFERLSKADSIRDAGRRASHLVRLADLIAGRDAARARSLLGEAMDLPCWKPGPGLDAAARRRLAFTAALAAHAFASVQDPEAAKESLQRARALALEADDPRPLLERIEQLADRGDTPPADR